MTITRRMIMRGGLAGGAALLGAGRLSAPALAQGDAAHTLRFIPQANLTALDPIWTTATVTAQHGYYVFDTLFGVNAAGEVKPQMAEGHEVLDDGKRLRITLRPGLKFHDGEPVRAKDCVASLQRWAARDGFGQLLAKVVDEWGAPSDRVIELRMKRAFPLALEAMAKLESNVCFMMPERLAKTDPNKGITEMIGSGPYRFKADEYNSGVRVVYEKFDGYVPRQEAPDFSTGAKIAHFPRVLWTIIPDPSTAAAALMNGEMDWWERPLADLQPLLASNPDIRREILDPLGRLALMRLNNLQPPFNDVKMRRAVLQSVIQENYMQAARGDDRETWSTTRSIFPRGTPYFEDHADLMPGSLEKAAATLKEAGYDKQKIVIINPTDFPDIGPLGQVTNDALRQLNTNVELAESDWGTVIQRRASREPVEKGGWSIFHTTGGTAYYGNPAMSPLIRGQGDKGWYGWWKNDKAEELTEAWLYEPDAEKQRALAMELGRLGLQEVSTIPLGQFTIRSAYRKDLEGILKGPVPFPWNVHRKT